MEYEKSGDWTYSFFFAVDFFGLFPFGTSPLGIGEETAIFLGGGAGSQIRVMGMIIT